MIQLLLHRRAVEKRDELASSQPIEGHAVPARASMGELQCRQIA